MTAKKKSTTRSKSIVKKPKVTAKHARLRKQPRYKSFRLHGSIKHPGPKLPSVLSMSRKAFRLLGANAKPITWFVVVYGLLSLIFVSGIAAPINIEQVRTELEQYAGADATFSNNVTILGLLLNSSFQASGDVSSVYQVIFVVTSSLALIWLFRQQQAGSKVSLKEAYYRGMFPLVPFLIIAGLIGLQAIPATIGNLLYGSVVAGGLAVTFVEQLLWFLFLLLTILLSLYFITSSIVALFVVTLPDMTPLVALREAKQLVAHRRPMVLWKLVALLAVMTAVYVAVVFPAIFISATLAQVLFFLLTVLALPFAVAYLFVLYRELL